MSVSDHATHAAISALDHLLASAAWATARLAPHAGRTLRLRAAPLQFDLAVDAEGYFTACDTTTFDVCIELPAVPEILLRGIDAATRTARIEGAADFAEALAFVLKNLRWDVEEDLSRWLGDIAAHRLTTTTRRLFGDAREAGRRLTENCAEYLTEERPLLVARPAMTTFASDVGQLASDLTRLEQRLAANTAMRRPD